MNVLFFLLLAVVVLAIAGAVVGGLLSILWWLLVGLVIGALGRLLVRGTGGMSILATALAGIAGALGGGLVAAALDLGGILQFIIAVLVAAFVVALLAGRRSDSVDRRRV